MHLKKALQDGFFLILSVPSSHTYIHKQPYVRKLRIVKYILLNCSNCYLFSFCSADSCFIAIVRCFFPAFPFSISLMIVRTTSKGIMICTEHNIQITEYPYGWRLLSSTAKEQGWCGGHFFPEMLYWWTEPECMEVVISCVEYIECISLCYIFYILCCALCVLWMILYCISVTFLDMLKVVVKNVMRFIIPLFFPFNSY